MLAYVVWASLFAMPGLLMASLLLEGPARDLQAVTASSWIVWPTLVWQSAANTLFGYAMWAALLTRYPAATVAPMSANVGRSPRLAARTRGPNASTGTASRE